MAVTGLAGITSGHNLKGKWEPTQAGRETKLGHMTRDSTASLVHAFCWYTHENQLIIVYNSILWDIDQQLLGIDRDINESCLFENGPDTTYIAERKGAGRTLSWFWGRWRGHDAPKYSGEKPWVLLSRLPARESQSSPSRDVRANVGEGPYGFIKKHHTKLTHCYVKWCPLDTVGLHIYDLKRNVLYSSFKDTATRQTDKRCGDVCTNHRSLPADELRGPHRGQSASTAEINNVFAGLKSEGLD